MELDDKESWIFKVSKLYDKKTEKVMLGKVDPDTQMQLISRSVCGNLDPERCIEKKLIWDQTSVTEFPLKQS